MNIKEYISTGILEAYVLDELTEMERRHVEQNLAASPELRKELALVEASVEKMLMMAARKPRPELKKKIVDAVQAQTPDMKVTPVVKPSEAKVVEMPEATRTVQMWRYATAASVVIALTSSVLAYNFWNNWKSTEVSLNDLIAERQQIAQDYNVVNQRLDKLQGELGILNNPSYRRVVLKGTEAAPEALASVYWNEATQETYLSIQNLKTLAQEQQYQLWAIVDGKPVDMGVFDSPAQLAGLIKMKNVKGAAAFAVTIEPRGGKPSPSLETMQVIGNS